MDSIVVIYLNKLYTQSDAAIVIAQQFKGLWKLLTVVKFIPKWLRDKVYIVITKNRYRLLGELDTCRIPTEEEKRRFL